MIFPLVIIGCVLLSTPAESIDDTCGVTQSCFRSPAVCFPPSSCTYFVGWSLTDAGDALNFEVSLAVSNSEGYAAIGFSKDGLMTNSDIIACTLDSRILRYYASARNTPLLKTNDGLSNEAGGSIMNGVLACSFTRQLNTDNGDSTFFDLTENHFLLVAKGQLNGDLLTYHFENKWISPVYNLQSADYRSMTTASPTQQANTGAFQTSETDGTTDTGAQNGTAVSGTTDLHVSPEASTALVEMEATTAAMVEESNPTMKNGDTCDVSQSCFRAPSACSPPSTCDMFVGWSLTPAKDAIDVELSMKIGIGSRFAAVGFSQSGGMDNSDVYLCTTDRRLLRFHNIGYTTQMGEKVGVSNEIVDPVVDGALHCTFTRKLSLMGAPGDFFNLSANNYYIISATSEMNGDVPSPHRIEDRFQSESDFDLSAADFTTGVSADDNYLAKIKAHGSLMVIAWIGFASVGIVTARFFKPFWPNSMPFGKNVWFIIHITCMISAWVLFASSFILIFIVKEGWIDLNIQKTNKKEFAHAICGTIAVILGTLNPIMAAFRPHPGTPRRPIFNFFHFSGGALAWLSSIVATFLGITIYYKEEKVSDIDAFHVMIVFAIFLVCMLIAFEVHGRISKRQSSRSSDIALDDIGGEQTGEGRVVRVKPEPAGATVRKLLYLLYLFGVVFTVVYLVISIVIKD